MGNPKSKTRQYEIEARERAIKALELRKAGYPFREIADQLGYADESGARRAVSGLLNREEYEAVDEYRAIELERLDKVFTRVYQMAIKGNLLAVDRVIKIMNRRAKLLGLDAPAKSEVNVKDWRTQAIADIKAGIVKYDALAVAFDDSLAAELFREAGVPVDAA